MMAAKSISRRHAQPSPMAATTSKISTLQSSPQSKLKRESFGIVSSSPFSFQSNGISRFWHSGQKAGCERKALPSIGLKIAESVRVAKCTRGSLVVKAGSKGGLKAKALWELQDSKRMPTDVCPCGGGLEKDRYQTCCARFHKNGLIPATALLLMRSRYTAYVKGLVDYLVESTHPEHPGYETMRKDIRDTVNRVRFKKLHIQEFADGEKEAFVTFKFDFSLGRGIDRHITERSRFVKEEGRWLFIGTEVLEDSDNDDCPSTPASELHV